MPKRKAPAPKKERSRTHVPPALWTTCVAEWELTYPAAMDEFLKRWGIAERTVYDLKARVDADPKLAAERDEKRRELRETLGEKLRDLMERAHVATLEAMVDQATKAKSEPRFDPKVFFALTGNHKVSLEQTTARKVLLPDEQRVRPDRSRAGDATPPAEGSGGGNGPPAGGPGLNGNGHVEPELVH